MARFHFLCSQLSLLVVFIGCVAAVPDRTIVNDILGGINVVVDTTQIPDERVTETFKGAFGGRGGEIRLFIQVGGSSKQPGFCNTFSINEGLFLTGSVSPNTFFFEDIPGTDVPFTGYFIDMAARRLGLVCEIPLRVKVEEVKLDVSPLPDIDVDLGPLQNDNTGTLRISTTTISLDQQIQLFSKDFTQIPPTESNVPRLGEPGGFRLRIDSLVVDANDVVTLFDDLEINSDCCKAVLDEEVEKAIRKDTSIILGPAEEKLGEVFVGLAEELAELIKFNDLTSENEDSLLGNQFTDTNNDGKIKALEIEEALNTTGINPVNFIKGNFLTDILFPKGGEEENKALDGFFDSIDGDLPGGAGTVSQADATALVVFAINSQFPEFNITEDLANVDLLRIINIVQNNPNDQPLTLVNDSFVTDFGNWTLRFFMNSLNFSQVPDSANTTNLLSSLEIIGKHTILLPGLNFGDFIADATFTLDISGKAEGLDNEFLPAFDITIPTENFFFGGIWEGFQGGVAALLAIDEDQLFDLQLGPLLDNPFDCLTSTLFAPSTITGASVGTSGITAAVGGFQDFITDFIGQVLNTILFAYQSVAARALETVLADQLVNRDIFTASTTCPELVQPANDTMYDFSVGIFKQITDLVDAQFVEQMFDFILDPEDGRASVRLLPRPFTFFFDIFPIQGWSQTITISINKINIRGLTPPTVNFASLSVPRSSENFPQGMVADVRFAEPSNRITLDLGLQVDFSNPFIKPFDLFPDLVPADQPPSIIANNASNTIDASVGFATVNVLIEVFAKLTQFDVDSMPIGNAINTDCWVERLDFPGGWHSINALVNQLNVEVDCDCETPLLLKLRTALVNPSGWAELTDILNDLVDLFEDFFPKQYNIRENFDFQVENGRRGCLGLPKLKQEFTIADAIKEDGSTAYTLIGFIAVSLSFTVPYSLASKKRKKKAKLTDLTTRAPDAPADAVGGPSDSAEDGSPAKLTLPSQGTEETTAMYKNKLIPKPMRILVPIIIFGNIGMFVYGDLGVAITIGLDGGILGAPLQLDEFAEFSVISSTLDLYKSGAYGLAILITVLALVWPYLKLFGLIICWFLDSRCLRISIRGKLLHFMDAFGKWSLIEIFFIIFLRLTFELSVRSPENTFLPPDEPIYFLDLLINPQPGLYTFVSAVVLSIVASNILVIYHEKIIRVNENMLLDMVIEEKNPDMYVLHAIKDWEFHVDPSYGPEYGWALTKRGIYVLSLLMLTMFALLWATIFTPIVHVEYTGLAALLLKFEGTNPLTKYSIASIADVVFQEAIAESDSGAIFLTFVYVFALIICPFIVFFMNVALLFKEFTLNQMREFKDWRVIMTAWASIEVVGLAMAIAVIEVPAIAGYIASDSCDFVEAFMTETLLPLGFVTEEDVQAKCFGINVKLESGIYILVLTVFLSTLSGYMLIKKFTTCIKQRRTNDTRPEMTYYEEHTAGETMHYTELEPLRLSKSHKLFRAMKVIKVFRVANK